MLMLHARHPPHGALPPAVQSRTVGMMPPSDSEEEEEEGEEVKEVKEGEPKEKKAEAKASTSTQPKTAGALHGVPLSRMCMYVPCTLQACMQ